MIRLILNGPRVLSFTKQFRSPSLLTSQSAVGLMPYAKIFPGSVYPSVSQSDILRSHSHENARSSLRRISSVIDDGSLLRCWPIQSAKEGSRILQPAGSLKYLDY